MNPINNIQMKRQRKSFNKFVRTLSELYDMPYYKVMAIYIKQERDIVNTRMHLNLINSNS